MKIKIELNPDLDNDETSVTIRAKAVTPEVEQIYRQLQGINSHPDQIECKKDNVSYYLSMNEILFFETEDKQVIAHTARDAFTVDYKLYELENLLNNQFMRVSKSTILNLNQIYALTRSISNCKINFRDSYKTVYVSRHYYHNLNDRLNERRSS